jgi:hypothetical protein
VAVEGEFELPFPVEAAVGKTVFGIDGRRRRTAGIHVCEKTGVLARQQLIDIKALEIREGPGDLPSVRL